MNIIIIYINATNIVFILYVYNNINIVMISVNDTNKITTFYHSEDRLCIFTKNITVYLKVEAFQIKIMFPRIFLGSKYKERDDFLIAVSKIIVRTIIVL